jgi:hypothetical protein
MVRSTCLLRKKLTEARAKGYHIDIPPLRPGQESIMMVRPNGESATSTTRPAKQPKLDR